MQLEIEKEALKQEESSSNLEKIQNIDSILKDLNNNENLYLYLNVPLILYI